MFFSGLILPIELPNVNTYLSYDMMYVIGWGNTETSRGSESKYTYYSN